MRGFMLEAPGRVVCEIPQPQCGPGRVLVRPRAVGICGSDIHAYAACSRRWYAVGSGARDSRRSSGDREGFERSRSVTMLCWIRHQLRNMQNVPCRKPNVCEHLKVLGVCQRRFADYVAVNEEQVL